jgi:transposase-like protein
VDIRTRHVRDVHPPYAAPVVVGMTRTIKVCPECDSSDIQVRVGGIWRDNKSGYTCMECDAHFDDAKEREEYNSPVLTGLAKKLDEYDKH